MNSFSAEFDVIDPKTILSILFLRHCRAERLISMKVDTGLNICSFSNNYNHIGVYETYLITVMKYILGLLSNRSRYTLAQVKVYLRVIGDSRRLPHINRSESVDR